MSRLTSTRTLVSAFIFTIFILTPFNNTHAASPTLEDIERQLKTLEQAIQKLQAQRLQKPNKQKTIAGQSAAPAPGSVRLFYDDFEGAALRASDGGKWDNAAGLANVVTTVPESAPFNGRQSLNIPYNLTPTNRDRNLYLGKNMREYNLHNFYVKGSFYIHGPVEQVDNAFNLRKLFYIYSQPVSDWTLIPGAWHGSPNSPAIELKVGSNSNPASDLGLGFTAAYNKVKYNQWNTIEVRVWLNTPGKRDGGLEFYLNDEKVVDAKGIAYRDKPSPLGIVNVGTQLDDAFTTDIRHEDRYWDDVEIGSLPPLAITQIHKAQDIRSFTASRSTINPGETTQLNWFAENTKKCQVENFKDVAGATGIFDVSPTQTTVYTLKCSTGPLTSDARENVVVTVNGSTPAVALPKMSISSSRQTITQGESADISWTSTDATSCSGLYGFAGVSGLSGSVTVTPDTSTRYTISCKKGSLSVSRTYIVNVKDALGVLTSVAVTSPTSGSPTPASTVTPTLTFSSTTSSLTWSTRNATACTASGDPTFTGAKSPNDTQTIAPTVTTTYTLTCTGTGGSVTRTATVNVASTSNPSIPQNPPTPPDNPLTNTTTPPSNPNQPNTPNNQIPTPPTPTPTPEPPRSNGGGGGGSTKSKESKSPERYQTTSILNVRSAPGTTAPSVGTQPIGVAGTLKEPPITKDGHTWYHMNYDNGTDGWSTNLYLKKISTTETKSDTKTTSTKSTKSSKSCTTKAKFTKNTKILITKAKTPVRDTPNGTTLTGKKLNAQGTITKDPTCTDTTIWYYVDFKKGTDGYVKEDRLKKS